VRRFLLIRLFGARRKLRYWRRYALALEKQLEGEVWRNREREDCLSSTYVRALGMFAPLERAGPAQPMSPLRRQAAKSPQTVEREWDHLTEEERTEWQIWREDAERNDVSLGKARAEFLEQLKFRKSHEM
jgi:hypothetical protein